MLTVFQSLGRVARRHWVFSAVILSILIAVGIGTTTPSLNSLVWRQGSGGDKADAEILLSIGRACKLYASINDAWPPTSQAPNPCRLDVALLDAALQQMPDERVQITARLAGKTGTPLCYLGYVVADEAAALMLLDLQDRQEKEGARYRDISLNDYVFIAPGFTDRAFRRVRDGVGYLREIGIPSGSTHISKRVPVLWEVPNEHASGGWVLYLSGDVEWIPFPGPFPMSEGLVARLRRVFATDTQDTDAMVGPSPVRALADEATCALQGDDMLILFGTGWRVCRCDLTPRVRAGSETGYRIVLQYEGYPQPPDYAPKANGRVRQKKDSLFHVQLTLFPTGSRVVAGDIPWDHLKDGHTPFAGDYKRDGCAPLEATAFPRDGVRTIDLGEGGGYRWFGRGTVAHLDAIRVALQLTGGYDRAHLIREAVAGVRSGVQAVQAMMWLADAGGNDPALVASAKKECLNAINDPKVNTWSVLWMADVVTRMGWPEALPGLQSRMAAPPNLSAYCRLLMAQRAAEGRPLAKSVEAALALTDLPRTGTAEIGDFAKEAADAQAALLTCPDREAAVVFAAKQAFLYIGKSDDRSQTAYHNFLGQTVLRAMPRDITLPVLRQLVSILPARHPASRSPPSGREMVARVLAELE